MSVFLALVFYVLMLKFIFYRFPPLSRKLTIKGKKEKVIIGGKERRERKEKGKRENIFP